MSDILGPANAANAVTTRIVETRVFPTADTWFKPCSTPAAQDGTQIQSLFLNGLLAQLRAAIRGNGKKNDGVTAIVAEDNTNDAMLLGAILQMIQRGQANFVVDTGTADAIVVAPVPALAEYEVGLRLLVLKNPLVGANTTTTPKINAGLGSATIVKNDGSALGIGDLRKAGLFEVEFDSAGNARLVSLLTIGDVLALIQSQTRVNLPGNLTVYVRPDGSDAGNGTTNTSSAAGGANCAFATIQGAIAATFGKYNLAGYTLKVQLALATGQTTANFAGVDVPSIGVIGSVLIQGDDANQGNYVITPVARTDGTSVCVTSEIPTVTVSGVTLDMSSVTQGGATLSTQTGSVNLGNVTVKLGSTPQANVFTTYPGGQINRTGNVTVLPGTVQGVFNIADGSDGGCSTPGGKTFTINNVAFTQFYNVDQGRASLQNTTFMGSGNTGSKYTVSNNGVITISNGSVAAIPGSTPGTLANGDQVPGDPGTPWTTYASPANPSSGSIASYSCTIRWRQIAPKTIALVGVLSITNNGTGAGTIGIGLPATANSSSVGAGRDSGNTGKALTVQAVAGQSGAQIQLYDNTYPGSNTATLTFSLTYETI